MVDVNDVRGLRVARAELSKRGIDTLRTDVRMTQGVLYLQGRVFLMPGFEVRNIQHEVEHIAQSLRQRPEIRDVVLDCNFAEGSTAKTTMPVATLN